MLECSQAGRYDGGEKGPVILVAFKAIDPVLRGQDGRFDSDTLPPTLDATQQGTP